MDGWMDGKALILSLNMLLLTFRSHEYYCMMLYTRLAVCMAVPEFAIHTAAPNPNPNPNHVHVHGRWSLIYRSVHLRGVVHYIIRVVGVSRVYSQLMHTAAVCISWKMIDHHGRGHSTGRDGRY